MKQGRHCGSLHPTCDRRSVFDSRLVQSFFNDVFFFFASHAYFSVSKQVCVVFYLPAALAGHRWMEGLETVGLSGENFVTAG